MMMMMSWQGINSYTNTNPNIGYADGKVTRTTTLQSDDDRLV